MSKNEFLSAVLINSRDPERLAAFYRDVLDVPLEVEMHGPHKHYGCELGDLHFAIHPVRGSAPSGAGAVDFALQVFDLDTFLKKLTAKGVEVELPVERGFARMTEIRDPDGNRIFLTELTKKWLGMIKDRRQQGHDLIKVAQDRGDV